jgi:Cyclic GMP-AMP synthase DncV-like, nucleotidyltransferase domain
MGIAASLFYSTSDAENCLDWRVRPSDEQYDSQKERWNDLADHLRADLAERSGYSIGSWLQGSYKFGTQVRPAASSQEFDIDLGIYFQWSGTPDDGRHSALDLCHSSKPA